MKCKGFLFLHHLKLYTVHVNDDIKLNTREFGGIRKTIVACSPIGLFWPLFHTKAAVYNKAMQRPEGPTIKNVVSDSVIFDPLRSQVKVLNLIVSLFQLLFPFNHNWRSIQKHLIGDIQWLHGQEEVVGGPKNIYFCPCSSLKMSTKR